MMTLNEFENLVERVIADIPGQFSERFVNLVFVVEQQPSSELLEEAGMAESEDLLGYYRGYPLDERLHDLVIQEPDMIYLFQKAIETEACVSRLSVEQVVRETVAHEVAHFFGFSEAELERFEKLWADSRA